jgi:surface antigen
MRRIELDELRRTAGALLALTLWIAALAPPAAAQINPFGRATTGLTSDDWTALNQARAKVMAEPAAVGSTQSWSNPKSGNSGTVSITGIVKHQGQECRAVTYVFHRRAQQARTARMNECKTADGTWKFL